MSYSLRLNSIKLQKLLSVLLYAPVLALFLTPFVTYSGFVDPIMKPKLVWFTFSTSLFSILFLLYDLNSSPKASLTINAIDICLLGFYLYVHIRQFYTDIPYDYSKISIYTAIVVCYVLLRVRLNHLALQTFTDFLKPVLFLSAFFTALIALYQFFFGVNSGNEIGMTVAMGNSGVVGSYLAMLFPWLVLFCNSSKKAFLKVFCIITLVLTVMTLLILKARAAWTAVFVSGLLLFIFQYKKHIKTHFRAIYTLGIGLVILSIIGIYTIFNIKQDSTNGRLFIWERTVELISDYPIFGVGFNKFGAIYPSYQASYLRDNPDDSAIFLASDINHPFNDYLNLTAELGIVGLLAFLILSYFTFLTMYNPVKQPAEATTLACYAGVSAFLILSLFTYPFEIPSIHFLFICFLAILSSKVKNKVVFTIPKPRTAIIISICCSIMFFNASSEFKRFESESSWHKIYQSRQTLSWKIRSRLYDEAYASNGSNWDFLSVYGIELTVNKQYNKAIEILSRATTYQKTSELYTHLGLSYEGIYDYETSEEAYKMAVNMVPHKFFPRYRLVLLYSKMGLHKKAVNLAEKIITTPAKVNSKTVQGIKREMRKFVKKYDDK